MDPTRDMIDAEIFKWDVQRAEAVRTHNACYGEDHHVRDVVWLLVKEREAFITSLRNCLSVHLANASVTGAAKPRTVDAVLDKEVRP